MNTKTCVLYLFVAFLLLQGGCKKDEPATTGPGASPAVINGSVRDAEYTSNAIVGAFVECVGGEVNPTAYSDTNGNFSLTFSGLTGDNPVYLLISAAGYNDTTIAIVVQPARTQSILILLERESGGGGVIITNPDVKKAAQVAYIGTSASDIYVAGVGALENSVVTYEVRDSLGEAVAKTPRYGAEFLINFYPNVNVGGGDPPHVIPNVDSTDAKGRLHVSIVSGSQAGVVEVFARIMVDSTKIITSLPVRITVHAGFPDQDHFTLLASRFVFPSMDSYHEIGFTAAVGDTFSNPVPEGWAVYFHSQAGIMQTGDENFTAYTDEKGLASVHLETVNPIPDRLPYCDTNYTEGRVGAAWVYAQTMGRSNLIVDSMLVIWNRAPVLIGLDGLPPSTYPTLGDSVTMPSNGVSRIVTMKVTDVNGNPLCDGSRINVYITYPTDLTGLKFEVTGNVPAKIPIAGYCRFPGPGVTDFSFSVIDNSRISYTGTVTLVISIESKELIGEDALVFKYPVYVQ